MTLEELVHDGDWGYVFGDSVGSSTSKDTEAVGLCPADPAPTRADVSRVIACRDGENDGDSWLGVFELRDGRFLFATGWCDYTGWG